MEIKLLDEPLLQFGKGEYVCPRTGIYKYNVSDINDIRPDKIVVGFIGLSESINIAISWIKKCGNHIEAKKSKQPNLLLIFQDLMKQSDFIAKLYMMNRIYVKLIIRPLTELKKKLMILIS